MLATTGFLLFAAVFARTGAMFDKISSAVGEPPTAELLEITECDDHKDLPISYDGIDLQQVSSYEFLMSGKVLVTEVLEGPINVQMQINKCKEKNDKNSCELYTKWKSEGCKELEEKKGTLYDMFKATGATETSCPLSKGSYALDKHKIAVPPPAAKMAVAVGNYWHVHIEGESQGRIVMCTDTMLAIENSKATRKRKF